MKKRIIKPCLLLLMIIPLLILSKVSFAQVQEFTGKVTGKSYPEYLNKYLRKYAVLALNPQEISTYVQAHSPKTQFILNLSGERFSLEIEPNDMRGKGFKAVSMTKSGATELSATFTKNYKGSELKDRSSVVRFNIDNNMFEGYIKAGNKWLFIDKLNRFVPGESDDKIVVYDSKEVIPDPTKTCGAEKLAAEQKKVGAQMQAQGLKTGNCSFLEIATEADYEYYQAFGSNASVALQRIRDILNLVEGVYTPTFNLKFILRYQQIWTTSSDPYSGTTLDDILPQFAQWWNNNRAAIARDDAQMYTGRSLTGAIGLAYLSSPLTPCNTSQSYNVVANYSPVTNETINLSAHEIGHNLSAGHDPDCDGSNIMCPHVQNGVPTWSSESVSYISTYIYHGEGCLGETIPADVTITGFGLISYLKAIASNSIEINSSIGAVLFANNGFGYLEAGGKIVLTPSNTSSPGFIAPEGSVVIMKISDVINTCDPAAVTASSSIVQNNQSERNVSAYKDVQVGPNPFHSSFDVKFYLENNEDVNISIYNMVGVKMKESVQKNLSRGQNKLSFNCSDYATGIYLVEIKIGTTKTIKKIMKF